MVALEDLRRGGAAIGGCRGCLRARTDSLRWSGAGLVYDHFIPSSFLIFSVLLGCFVRLSLSLVVRWMQWGRGYDGRLRSEESLVQATFGAPDRRSSRIGTTATVVRGTGGGGRGGGPE